MKLDDVIFVLKAIPLFRKVESDALRLLAFSATRRQLRAGDVLFRKGEVSDGGYLILDGEVVLDTGDDGKPSQHAFKAGTLIGQTALFAPIERSATAVAREPTSLLVFPRSLMGRVLDEHPRSALILRNAIADDAKRLATTIERAAGSA
ncbi:Crp cAMP-binding proteins - catabolite gene activator and regulatory subunit of cAMP-dependent protein kinases [Rhabdaerophilaceae bacterium]